MQSFLAKKSQQIYCDFFKLYLIFKNNGYALLLAKQTILRLCLNLLQSSFCIHRILDLLLLLP